MFSGSTAVIETVRAVLESGRIQISTSYLGKKQVDNLICVLMEANAMGYPDLQAHVLPTLAARAQQQVQHQQAQQQAVQKQQQVQQQQAQAQAKAQAQQAQQQAQAQAHARAEERKAEQLRQ